MPLTVPFRDWVPQCDVPLAPLTTLKLGGPAAFYAKVETLEDIASGVAWAQHRGVALVVLGGGSNVVIADAGFDGLVLHMQRQGIATVQERNRVELTVAAGVEWDQLVGHTTAKGWAGLECLAGIPGQVGSTPIQNVGAYGQDVSESIQRIRVMERSTSQALWIEASDLGFGYRDSVLRRNPQRWIVLDVVFHLRAGGAPIVRYAEVQKALSHLEAPSLSDVRAKVLELRRRKSMVLDALDPNSQSAGSFFTNPIVSVDAAVQVASIAKARGVGELPQWPLPDGRVKLAAAWLIENAGFARGHRSGAVGISSAHALALVHYGGGTSSALLGLARDVREGVFQAFGVALAAEPIILG